MILISRQPLTQTDIDRVKDILRQSICPNESLQYTFGARYSGMCNGKIFFDDAQNIFNELSDMQDFSALACQMVNRQLIATVI